MITNIILNQGEANALISKFEAALKSIDKGNENANCGQLVAYINQVNILINSGKLDPVDEQPLTYSAQNVIDELSGGQLRRVEASSLTSR